MTNTYFASMANMQIRNNSVGHNHINGIYNLHTGNQGGLGLVRFNIPLDTLGHFGDESSQAINCTGTDKKS